MAPTPLHESSNGEVSAGRKRQRQVQFNGPTTPEEPPTIPAAAAAAEGGGTAPKPKKKGLRQKLSLARLRRPGALQREVSNVQTSEVAQHISRENRFMEGLPLKAPYIEEEVCGDCGKVDCECDLESDDEAEVEEIPKDFCGRILHGIRLKTDVVRDYSGRIVNDQGFQIFIVILILINSLFIGLSTFDFIEDNPKAFEAFRITDLAFLIIFTIELIMQFLYHGYNLFLDGWLMFDLFIVITSWTLESISVLRTLRLRSFRIFRAFRLTTRIRALRRLVEAIFDVLPKITAIICMFCLIIYIFGVMCVELFGDIDYTDRFQDPQAGQYSYFKRLDDALFTLFVMVTLDWAAVARATMQVYGWAWVIFSTFVTFSSFVLYNLIIAVVCDAVKMVQDQQDILMVENYVKDKIESRHRIINLRQKLDKMSKQQMDLLLYVQLILEQIDDVDEDSKQHYEKTLLQLSQSNQNARDSLQNAIRKLDKFEGVEPLTGKDSERQANNTSSRKLAGNRRVSFNDAHQISHLSDEDDIKYEDAREQTYSSQIELHDTSAFGDYDGLLGMGMNDSFHSCRPMPEYGRMDSLE